MMGQIIVEERFIRHLLDAVVHLRRIGLVVDHAAVDFDPGMGFEGHLLRTNDHLSRYAILL